MSGSESIEVGSLNLLGEFRTLGERVAEEREKRVANGADLLSFGVPFLDECLGGIAANDLILVASKTGQGKTQLVSHIALSNVRQGKRVYFFALEAEEYEIERRLKYQIIADKFFSMADRPRLTLNYMDWYYGRFNEQLDAIEKEADEELRSYRNLFVFYRKGEFTAKDFQRLCLGVKSQADLIIADHLHYFDFDEGNDNENRALKDTVKSIRDTALISGKPIILVSHVRKIDRRMKVLVPGIEDLHGSSDIGKIGTKVITIAPLYEEKPGEHRKTYFNISKCRVDGARNEMTGVLAFNISNHRYERQYYLGKLSVDGTEVKLFDYSRMPFWAVNGIVPK